MLSIFRLGILRGNIVETVIGMSMAMFTCVFLVTGTGIVSWASLLPALQQFKVFIIYIMISNLFYFVF